MDGRCVLSCAGFVGPGDAVGLGHEPNKLSLLDQIAEQRSDCCALFSW
jgi:hypothetical protein